MRAMIAIVAVMLCSCSGFRDEVNADDGTADATLLTRAAMPSEKATTTVGNSWTSSRPYPGIVYLHCSARCYWKLCEPLEIETCVATISDNTLDAGITTGIDGMDMHITVTPYNVTVNSKLSEFWNENVAWTTLFPISTDWPYAGLVQVQCTRQARLKITESLAGPDTGVQIVGTMPHTMYIESGIIVNTAASNGQCSFSAVVFE